MTPQECAANFLSVAYKKGTTTLKPLNFKPVAPSLSDTVYKSNSNRLLMAEAASNPTESTFKVVDICASTNVDRLKYLIQPYYFMTVTSLSALEGTTPTKLNDFCEGGDHYMAHTRERKSSKSKSNDSIPFDPSPPATVMETWFFIIRKKKAEVTEDISLVRPTHYKTYSLCSAYEDGQYFLADSTWFYIIKSDFTFIKTSNLENGCIDETPRKLHDQLQKGKFYFSSGDFFYVVKENGGQIFYQRTKSLGTDAEVEYQEVSITSEMTLNFFRNEYQSSNEKGM